MRCVKVDVSQGELDALVIKGLFVRGTTGQFQSEHGDFVA